MHDPTQFWMLWRPQNSNFPKAKLTKVRTAPGPLPHSTHDAPPRTHRGLSQLHHSSFKQMQGPQYAMLVHLAMMLSTSNGWVIAADDKAHDSSPLAAHDSAITGEVDGGRARRQLASNCIHSWSACPHRARSCPSEPCADACGLLARSDAYTCPDSGSGGSSCDDACDTGCNSGCDWCDDSCDTQCDGFFGGSCDGECNHGCDGSCDGGCTSSCDGGCDTCETLLRLSCDSSCTNGCSPCPYGQYSAASTSLVSPPSTPWPSRQASSRPTPRVSSGPHTATPHARTITHTTPARWFVITT